MKRLLAGLLTALFFLIALPAQAGTIITGDSTSTVLANGAIFTGEPFPTDRLTSITVSVFTSHASATNGLQIQQSTNGTNWDIVDSYTIAVTGAGGGVTYNVPVTAAWARVVYTNGGTLQTTFRLQTIAQPTQQATQVVRPQDARSNEIDVNETMAYNSLFNGTTWDRAFTCDQSAVINVAAAATGQLVALTAGQIIRVCSFVISGDTLATTAAFVYGTGALCATGQVALTGAMRMPDEGSIALAAGSGSSVFRTIAANALCLSAVTGAVTGFVTYAKY